VIADQGRGVDAGKERRLAGGALRQAGHAQAGVDRAQGQEAVLGCDVQHQRAAEQPVQAGHRRGAQRVVRAGRRQAHPVEKDKQNPAATWGSRAGWSAHSL